jgi:hypothetical protein
MEIPKTNPIMILHNELKLTTPFLGCKQVPGRPRRILRDELGRPGLIGKVWQDHFAAAAKLLDVSFDRNMIAFPKGFEATKFEEHLRRFDRFKRERFESIPKGAIISFEVTLPSSRLTPQDYAKILVVVGERFGISQFGNKFNYGRFQVEAVKRRTLDVKLDFDFDV